ncbi:radical SAM protein [Anatilimnocola sp. NA78]|uniref:radical SAM protein n=1 Tax=Anatilimnocola sp. NA78 TaxID=3415683 RepID=UPI003CE46DFD
MPAHRDYTFLGTTQSLCPECLGLVPTKIITRGKRVYFRKTCPTHGLREDFVCSDVAYYDDHQFSVPAKLPEMVGVEPDKGCPFDCGLCTEHEQHTCVGLVEITGSCNLTCPMCYASSAPGGKHLSFEQVTAAIDRLVQVEGRAEVLQLSGGEPTVHPEFERIVEYALAQPIDYVQINTNGIRLATDPALVERLAEHRDRLEIFLQFDGLNDSVYQQLRGEPLLEMKLRAIELLGQHDLHITLASTLQAGVNDDQWGPIVKFALDRPWITGLNLQPATYSGRYYLPEEIDRRITFPQVIEGLSEQTAGLLQPDDFMPLPCAHPNCHSLAMIFRSEAAGHVPVNRFFDVKQNYDLLANGISFTRAKSRELAMQYLSRQACCEGGCAPPAEESNGLPMFGSASPFPQIDATLLSKLTPAAMEFFGRVLNEQMGARDLFRITITSFLDAYNFDVRRVMKCCTHHVLPSGHVIPFCAYNVLYRPGHVALPPLTIQQLVRTP